MMYIDFVDLLKRGIVQMPTDEELEKYIENTNLYLEHARLILKNKKVYYGDCFDNITVGQFIEIQDCKDFDDFLRVLKIKGIDSFDVMCSDYRLVLLFMYFIKKKMVGIGKEMEKASIDPLPDERGLEGVRDESLKNLHMLNFARENFGYKSFEEAENHPLAEVIVLMRLQSDDEKYRRALENKITKKHIKH